MIKKEKALREALNECNRRDMDINKCLSKKGYRLEEIKTTKIEMPKFKIPEFKPQRIPIKEFDNIQTALKKLRRLRGL